MPKKTDKIIEPIDADLDRVVGAVVRSSPKDIDQSSAKSSGSIKVQGVEIHLASREGRKEIYFSTLPARSLNPAVNSDCKNETRFSPLRPATWA